VRKVAKLLLGLATAWQLAYMLLYAGTLLQVLASGFAPLPAGAASLPEGFGALFAVHLATLVLMLALAAFYLAHAVRSPRVPARWRGAWIAGNVLGGVLAQLPYWYLYVWREPDPLPTACVRPGPGAPDVTPSSSASPGSPG
jgi:hypothetical protein